MASISGDFEPGGDSVPGHKHCSCTLEPAQARGCRNLVTLERALRPDTQHTGRVVMIKRSAFLDHLYRSTITSRRKARNSTASSRGCTSRDDGGIVSRLARSLDRLLKLATVCMCAFESCRWKQQHQPSESRPFCHHREARGDSCSDIEKCSAISSELTTFQDLARGRRLPGGKL